MREIDIREEKRETEDEEKFKVTERREREKKKIERAMCR